MTPVDRVVGEGQLVDELHITFTHSKPMPWFLPNIPPTHKKVAGVDIVVVVQFRGAKLACERILGSCRSAATSGLIAGVGCCPT